MNTPTKALFACLSVFALASCEPGGTSMSSPNRPGVSYDDGLPIDERKISDVEFSQLQLEGIDELGRRVLPMGSFKDGEHHVGLFYHIWLGQHDYDFRGNTGPRDIDSLLSSEEGRKALFSEDDPLSPNGRFHTWGKPLYGYYNSADPWVIRKHLELFANCGVDYLCFDTTNAVIYEDVIPTILDAILFYQAQGIKVPQVMFYTNTSSGQTVQMLFNAYYTQEKWASCWWAPNGKPRIVGITENNGKASDQTMYEGKNPVMSKDMVEYFDVLESQWPNGMYNENGQPWMSWSRAPGGAMSQSGMTYGYPQKVHNGHIAVPVAQHNHDLICYSLEGDESARGYNPETDEKEGDWKEGLAFQKMFDTALDPKNGVTDVFVTGWNEWQAIKQWDGTNIGYGGDKGIYFVDTWNHEYSRDLEMMEGGYGDNYYMQFVMNARAYKMNQYVEYAHERKSIDVNDFSADAWSGISHRYVDPTGDCEDRDFVGITVPAHYSDDSGRNDIASAMVTNDSSKAYFRIDCNAAIDSGEKGDALVILLGRGASGQGFMGAYEYRIGASKAEGKASLERYENGEWVSLSSSIEYAIQGNAMQIAIPLSDLGLTGDRASFVFKVYDNVSDPDDPMSYYQSGDSMPLGRLGYRY